MPPEEGQGQPDSLFVIFQESDRPEPDEHVIPEEACISDLTTNLSQVGHLTRSIQVIAVIDQITDVVSADRRDSHWPLSQLDGSLDELDRSK
jgi:hypothetical protein